MHAHKFDAVSGVNDAPLTPQVSLIVAEESGVDKAGRPYGIGRIGRLEKRSLCRSTRLS